VNVGDLIATLRLDAAGFTNGIKSAANDTAGFTKFLKDADRVLNELDKSHKTVTVSTIAFGAALGTLAAQGLELGIQKLTAFIGQTLDLGREVRMQEAAFQAMTAALGQNAKAIREALDTATHGMLDFTSATSDVNRLLGQGFKADQLAELGRIARTVAVIMGTDVTTAFNQVSEAVLSGQTRQLRAAGIYVDLQHAVEQYANAAGRSADAISEAGRSQAVYNAVIAATRGQYQALNGALDPTLTKAEQFAQKWNSVKERVGEAADVIRTKIIAMILDNWPAINKLIDLTTETFGAMVPLVEKLGPAIKDTFDAIGQIADFVHEKLKTDLDDIARLIALYEVLRGRGPALPVPGSAMIQGPEAPVPERAPGPGLRAAIQPPAAFFPDKDAINAATLAMAKLTHEMIMGTIDAGTLAARFIAVRESLVPFAAGNLEAAAKVRDLDEQIKKLNEDVRVQGLGESTRAQADFEGAVAVTTGALKDADIAVTELNRQLADGLIAPLDYEAAIQAVVDALRAVPVAAEGAGEQTKQLQDQVEGLSAALRKMRSERAERIAGPQADEAAAFQNFADQRVRIEAATSANELHILEENIAARAVIMAQIPEQSRMFEELRLANLRDSLTKGLLLERTYQDQVREIEMAAQESYVQQLELRASAATRAANLMLREQVATAQLSGDAWGVFTARFQQEVASWGTMLQQFGDLGAGVARDLEHAFAESFFDVMKGNFKGLDDVWKSFLDAVLRQIAAFLAASAVQELLAFVRSLGKLNIGTGSESSPSPSGGGGGGGSSIPWGDIFKWGSSLVFDQKTSLSLEQQRTTEAGTQLRLEQSRSVAAGRTGAGATGGGGAAGTGATGGNVASGSIGGVALDFGTAMDIARSGFKDLVGVITGGPIGLAISIATNVAAAYARGKTAADELAASTLANSQAQITAMHAIDRNTQATGLNASAQALATATMQDSERARELESLAIEGQTVAIEGLSTELDLSIESTTGLTDAVADLSTALDPGLTGAATNAAAAVTGAVAGINDAIDSIGAPGATPAPGTPGGGPQPGFGPGGSFTGGGPADRGVTPGPSGPAEGGFGPGGGNPGGPAQGGGGFGAADSPSGDRGGFEERRRDSTALVTQTLHAVEAAHALLLAFQAVAAASEDVSANLQISSDTGLALAAQLLDTSHGVGDMADEAMRFGEALVSGTIPARDLTGLFSALAHEHGPGFVRALEQALIALGLSKDATDELLRMIEEIAGTEIIIPVSFDVGPLNLPGAGGGPDRGGDSGGGGEGGGQFSPVFTPSPPDIFDNRQTGLLEGPLTRTGWFFGHKDELVATADQGKAILDALRGIGSDGPQTVALLRRIAESIEQATRPRGGRRAGAVA
jgi:hypothetical protein